MAVKQRACIAARQRVDQHPRVEQSLRIHRPLGGPERVGKERRPLLVVPRAVVAANRMMVGDRPTRSDQRLAGGALDRPPLCGQLSPCRPRAWNVKYGAGPSG